MSVGEHPSYFVLDRMALGLEAGADARSHVAGCERCQAYLKELGRPLAVPDWVHDRPSASPFSAIVASARGWRILAGATAGALGLFVLILAGMPSSITPTTPSSPSEEALYTTARGAPSVGLYIKRGQRVSLWDGEQSVAPGDRLRLKVVPEGFTHVAVFTAQPSSSNEGRQLLFASQIDDEGETMLPRAWEVDEAPGSELLIVVLGHEPLVGEQSVWEPRQDAPRAGLWMRTLRISKRAVAKTREKVVEEEER